MQSSTYKPYYEPYPSAFKSIEYPMRWLHDSREKSGAISLPNLMLRSFVCPITVCISPLTMLADIVIGIAEVSFAHYKGCDRDILKSIAHKKIIASPIQHIIFIAVNGGGCLAFAAWFLINYRIPFVLGLSFSGGIMMLTYGYSQKVVGLLPKWAVPDGFNIFIGGGARDIHGNKYSEYFDKQYQKYKREQGYQKSECWEDDLFQGYPKPEWWGNDFFQGRQKYQQRDRTEGGTHFPPKTASWDWESEYTKVINELKLKEIKTELTNYDRFKNGIFNKVKPIQLLGLKENSTKDERKAVYRAFSLMLHPDKNRNLEEEAKALMQLFFSIYHKLDKD